MGDTSRFRHRDAVAAGLEGAPMSAAKAQTYVVQSGDTLWEIAYERNLSVETLLRFNPKLDADFIQPGDRVHLPSSDELLRNMKRKVPAPHPAPQPARVEVDDEEEDEAVEDEGDWPPPGSKVHRAIMDRHMTDKPSPIVVVVGTVAVAVAIRVLSRVLRKNGTQSAPSDEITPVKPIASRNSRRKSISNVIGAVGKCAAFVKDTVGKVLILETESGSPPATPEIPQKLPAPAVFRDDPRHSAREEISPSYSGGSVASEASARSSASAAPSMADVLLVVKRAGGGENLTVHSTTRDVAVEIERALVRLARDKTRERERFDRSTATSGQNNKQTKDAGADAAAAAERAALQQELQAALTAVAAFKEAETIQAAMAAEANARCAALEMTLAEERAKVARLLVQEREREKAKQEAAREAAAFHSPPVMIKSVPQSPSDAGSPEAETERVALGNGGAREAFRVPLGGLSPASDARPSSNGVALPRGGNGGGNVSFRSAAGSYGGAVSTSGSAAEAEAAVMRQAEEKAAAIHASAALKAMTAAVEALDAAMTFDSTSPEAKEVTVKVRQQDWSVSQSNQSMRYTAAAGESSSSSRGSGASQDTPGTPPLDSDTLSPQSMLRQPEPSPAAPTPPLPRMSSGYGGTMAYKASLRGVSGDRGGSIYDSSPRFSYT